MNSGIYRIRNLENNWSYIGSAVNFQIRWRNHKNNLLGNRHENSHLQNAWNKYGPENFIFEEIEKWPIENLLEREQYWLDLYKPFYKKNCYNIGLFASAPTRGLFGKDHFADGELAASGGTTHL